MSLALGHRHGGHSIGEYVAACLAGVYRLKMHSASCRSRPLMFGLPVRNAASRSSGFIDLTGNLSLAAIKQR